jgi:WD40 repeat protein/tetratricopeptide (TPR) repeat protein
VFRDELVAVMAVSPDGGRFATGHTNGVARLWETTTGLAIGEPLQHDGPLSILGASAVALLGSAPGPGPFLAAFAFYAGRAREAWVTHVEFSPDGRLLATTGQDKTARVWNAATGNRIAKMQHQHAVRWAAFSPDDRLLVTASGDLSADLNDLYEPSSDPGRPGEARVWEAATGRPVTPPMHHEGVVQRASFSPDGRFLLTTCVSRAADRYQVQVWDRATGQPVTKPLVHPQTVWHETFSPGGRLVATGCADGAARIWHLVGQAFEPDSPRGVRLESLTYVLAKHGGPVWHVAFSADARHLLTASDDGTARVWDVTTGQLVALLRHGSAVRHALFAPDGHSVITGSMDNRVRLWPLASDHRPLDDWAALAEVLAGGADASRDPGREETLVSTWQRLRAKYPGDFATTKTEQLAWHRAALETAAWKKTWQAALAHLTRLLDIDPADWQNRLARARMLARLERWEEAEAEFMRAVEGHPRVPEVWVARGSFFLTRGQQERAEPDFAKAIDLQASPYLPAVLSEFWVAGLYPEDLQASFPPESELDPSRAIPALAGPKDNLPVLPRWRSETPNRSGYLNLAACFDGAEHISAYALAYVYAKAEQDVILWVGSDDDIRLWLNGRLIHENPITRGPAPDEDRVPGRLRPGWNTVLAKVVNRTHEHGLFLRLSADPRDLAEPAVPERP